MVEAVKNFLGVKSNDIGATAEIEDLIKACEEDMIGVGVSKTIATYMHHPLGKLAKKLYAKGYFRGGDENFRRAYRDLRDSLALRKG